MDLAMATDQLYAGSPDDFVERRKALAAEARAAKDRTLATAIGKLRRPTRSAWLVNLYAREAAAELDALLDLGAALQAAQEQLSVTELRRLSGERQKTLAAATRSAVALGETHGYVATEAVRQEVGQTLQAALADPDVADQVRAGRVTEAHTYGGFGVFGLGTPQTSGPTPELSASEVAIATQASDNSEVVAAEQALQEAEEALSVAGQAAEEAAAYAAELADRVATLRTELAGAERAAAEAEQLSAAARDEVGARDADVRAARERLDAF